MTEEWRILEENSKFSISNLGNLKNNDTNKYCKQYLDRYGYLYVYLRIDKKTKFKKVHRLVAKYFLSNYSELLQVNHKDEDKTNNQVTNLEMCNNKYNCNYGTRKTVLSKPILQYNLDGSFVKEWMSLREIERTLGFPHSSISNCCKGKDYNNCKITQAYNYVWRFK